MSCSAVIRCPAASSISHWPISTQVNILEDALKDAQKKTMLEDYSVDPAALRR